MQAGIARHMDEFVSLAMENSCVAATMNYCSGHA